MTDNVVSFKAHQLKAIHKKKEAGIEKIKNKFEAALPAKNLAEEKPMSLFKKKKKNTRSPRKKK